MVAVAAAGLGITVLGPQTGCFPKTAALKVCAATVPAPAKRPAVPTSGYRRRPRSADFSLIAPASHVVPARRAVGRGYAAGW